MLSPSPYKKIQLNQHIYHQYKNMNNQIGNEQLSQRLRQILLTLNEEKRQFQQKFTNQRLILQQKIVILQQDLKNLQYHNQKLQQQSKQIKFNYRQRELTIDYLKKKIKTIQKKNQLDNQKNVSVLDYLQNRNDQLNQVIFEMKEKQKQMSQTIKRLEAKLTEENNFKENQRNSLNLKNANFVKTSFSSKNQLLTPKNPQKMHRKSQISFDYRQNIKNFNTFQSLQNSICETMQDSRIKQKKIIENPIYSSVNSNNHHVNIEERHQISGKKILINSYGHLSFGDCIPRRKSELNSTRTLSSIQGSSRSFNQILQQKNLKQIE